MPALHLTEAVVRDIKRPPKPKQIQYFDTLRRGVALVLTVSYGGTRSFQSMTYNANGKAVSKSLGAFPRLSVANAKQLALDHFYKKETDVAQPQVATFKEVADGWLEHHVVRAKLRTEHEIRRMLTKYVYPEFEAVQFVQVRRLQVSQLLNKIAKDHGLTQANSVLGVIRSVCNWHSQSDEDYRSPIIGSMKKPANAPRDRILNDDEIRAVGQAAEGTFGSLVKVLLLTAQRRSKTVMMKWSDLADGV